VMRWCELASCGFGAADKLSATEASGWYTHLRWSQCCCRAGSVTSRCWLFACFMVLSSSTMRSESALPHQWLDAALLDLVVFMPVMVSATGAPLEYD
jgi:hypothetical protein